MLRKKGASEKVKKTSWTLKKPSKQKVIEKAREFKGSLGYRFKQVWANNYYKFSLITLTLMLVTSFVMMELEKDSGMYTGDIDKSFLGRFISSMYFGIVTISTSGYGDYTPRTMLGRVYCIFFIVSGVLMYSLLTATIASVLVEQKLKEGKGLGDLSNMKNHFIICGWKKNMESVLVDFACRMPDFKSRDLVIIANVDPDKAEMIKQQNPPLSNFHFLRGDYFNEVMLKKANVMEARQVFILADESEDTSASETDSKTVMAAMTINTLTREVRMCAELLDTKYERYLANAHVDEIIYTNDYGRLMLANTGAFTGVSSVFNHLLDARTEVRVATRPFPEEFIGKTFAELRDYFRAENGANLIGLLENVGSYWMHKKEAIREAQKTTDISKLVTNLQKISTMQSNMPNLHPPEDYAVSANTLGIVLERGASCAIGG